MDSSWRFIRSRQDLEALLEASAPLERKTRLKRSMKTMNTITRIKDF
jgi:hypothetical protein